LAQSIVANTAVAAAGRALNVALGIIVLGLISRLLGAETFGSYSTLLAYGAILQIVADLGLYLTLTRLIAQYPEQENHYVANAILLRLALSILVFGGGFLVAFFIVPRPDVAAAYGIMSAGFAAQSLSQLFMGVYQKYGIVWRATVGDSIGRIAQVVGILMIGTARANLFSMTALFTLATVVAALLHRALLPRNIVIRAQFAWSTWRHLIVASFPLGALLILNAIYFRVDILILSLYRPGSDVGFYGLAYRLVESILFLPAMFGGLLLPRISAAWQNSQLGQLREYLSQGLLAAMWAGGFIVLSISIWTEPIIMLIAGPEYGAAAPLLRILALALAAMFFGNIAGFALVACHRQKALLVLATTLAAANIVLNVLTIPFWGAPAAAWTTVVTEVLAATTAMLIAYRLIRFSLPRAALGKLVMALVLTTAVYWFIPASWPVVAIVTVGFVTYVISGRLLGFLTSRTFRVLLASP
jgi:O-antigen/teichoic acid export membrane protein